MSSLVCLVLLAPRFFEAAVLRLSELYMKISESKRVEAWNSSAQSLAKFREPSLSKATVRA